MLKSIKSIMGSKVMNFTESTTLGEVVDWIVNPEKRKINAFLVRTGGWFSKLMALSSLDVVEYGPKIIVVKNSDVLGTPSEVMNRPKAIKQKGRLLGSPVFTTIGAKLGVVDDVLFETADTSIQKIYVSPNGVSSLHQPDLIITIDRIVEILPNKIIVKENGADIERVGEVAGVKI